MKPIVLLFAFIISTGLLSNLDSTNKKSEPQLIKASYWIIHYDFSETPFDELDSIIIKDFCERLKYFSHSKLELGAHMDCVNAEKDSAKYIDNLVEKKIFKIMEYYGITSDRCTYVHYKDEYSKNDCDCRPNMRECTQAEYQINRRIEIKIKRSR